eukprot:PLAT5582.2.p2 GENE.PLAT5582.2~~PLAT5582.2.p2  ORF type:complete len:335 (+),score=151.79 PLAT5582.2:33-1037(+)
MGKGSGRGGDSDTGWAVVLTLCGVMTFISIFLIAFSFSALVPNDMALIYDANVLQLRTDAAYNTDARGKDSGRWGTGLGVHFIRFPKTQQKILMSDEDDSDASSITARTIEGLTIKIALSAQYSIKRNVKDLTELYMEYGENNWQPTFVRFIRGIARDVAAEYRLNDYFEQRETISRHIQRELAAFLDENAHVTLDGSQILDISIPDQIKNAILDTAIAFQRIGQASFQKQAREVQATTRVLEARESVAILLDTAQANAEVAVVSTSASAEAFRVVTAAEQDVYQTLRDTLELTNDELLVYLWLLNVQEVTSASDIFSISKPALLSFGSSGASP